MREQIAGVENTGAENAGVDKVWKAIRILGWIVVWLPQFPRVRTNNLKHMHPQYLRSADTRALQFKRELKNWLFESSVYMAGGTYDRRWWKSRRINGLTYLLTLYRAIVHSKCKNKLRTTITKELKINIYTLASIMF